MWIFGYGSLIWKVDFPYERKLVGYIEGYCRRFWQGNEDHRGTPEQPGRVVTLTHTEPEDRVYGVAFEIPKEHEEEVSAHLDYRERGGYERQTVLFHPEDKTNESFYLDIYIGTDDNPFYLGHASMTEIAQQIYHARGPSGPNTEYLYRLASAMRNLGVQDNHLEELEGEVQKLEEVKKLNRSQAEKKNLGIPATHHEEFEEEAQTLEEVEKLEKSKSNKKQSKMCKIV